MFKHVPRQWKKFGLASLGILFVCSLPLFLTFIPPIETTSTDGQFKCYVKTSIIPSKLYDSEVQVENIKSGEIVTAKKLQGGLFEEMPINLSWDKNGKYFTYVYEAEVIGKTSARFYVNASPFEVTIETPEDIRM